MWIVVLTMLIVACLITILVINKITDKRQILLDSEDGAWWARIIACIIAAILFCIIIYNIYVIIECKTFPEKVLFEYVKKLYDTGIANR
jgi:phosphoglycerol transferase MdoB-like AlkP superfamily enzyme